MKPKKTLKSGLLIKDVGKKTDYGVFKEDVLICWIGKKSVKKEDVEPGKFKVKLDDNLKYRIIK
jgi:hypothetical protein